VFWCLLGAFLIASFACVFSPDASPLLAEVAVALFSAATIAGITCTLPLQNAIAAAVLSVAIVALSLALTERSLLWPFPLLWTAIILNSRGVARLIVRRWVTLPNPGLWIIGIACVLIGFTALGFELFEVQAGELSAGPLVRYVFRWAASALVVLVATYPWMLDKKLMLPPTPNREPAYAWLSFHAVIVVAYVTAGVWDATAVELVIILATVVLSLRGAANRAPA
jgi:hypothetical protein